MNGFGPDGGQILADCIKQNAALEELNISSNRLNTRNAFAIAEALLSNDSLRVLKVIICQFFTFDSIKKNNNIYYRLEIIKLIVMVHLLFFFVLRQMNQI